MLDIGFSEIALIFTLALIVLGPEKLPKVASQVGRWIGRARGMARQFREQLEEEVNLEETRRTQPPVSHAPPPAQPTPGPVTEAVPIPPPPEPEQPVYPDTYSHAHATDSQGRPIPSPTNEPATADSGQQDWVGGVTEPQKTTPAGHDNGAYASSHERGT